MTYKFIDNKGTFVIKNPQENKTYFPLTNEKGSLLSSISPNLGGDIKADNNRFLTTPATIEDIKHNFLCRRDFFIRIGKKVIRASLPYNDTLEAGLLYHKITKKSGPLNIEILNFIPHSLNAEVMWVKIINKSKRTLKITPTSFVPLYARGEKNIRDHRHVSSLLNRVYLNKYGITLKPTIIFDEKGHKKNETTYFVLGFEGNANPPIGQFPTLDYFCGKGDLVNPSAIENTVKPINKKSPEFDGKEVAAAFRYEDKSLKPNSEANYFIIMGIDSEGSNSKQISRIFSKLNSPLKIKKELKYTKEYWQNLSSIINFDFKDKNFNNWLIWVGIQPTLRKLFGCSFLPHFDYGKGGRGWRDIWQDTLTLLLKEDNNAEKFLLNGFKGVRIDGSNATIVTKNGAFASDRNQISRTWMDHGIWPYISLRLYLNRTKNLNLLEKNIPYFRDHLLKRTKEIDSSFTQKDNLLRTKNKEVYKGSVLEHILVQHLTSFFNVGKHNIIRLENADWNDGLDMAAQNGESVTFSCMYAYNLNNLCIFLKELQKKKSSVSLLKEISLLLDKINKPVNYNSAREKQRRLSEYLEKTKEINGQKITVKISDLILDLEKKSEHLSRWLREKEWLKAGFFNGYYDNKARRVAGIKQGKVRMSLAPQVFAIMSGIATDDQIKQVWHSIKKHLKDPKLGGFRLNTNFKSLCLDLGRCFSFSYGDKENGAIFSHMVVMLSFALYSRGFAKEGWEAMDSLYEMASSNKSQIYPSIPEYCNNEGKGLYLYLTGSASWYIYNLIEKIFGIKFSLGKIFLQPNILPDNFFKNEIEVTLPFKKKMITVSYLKDNPGKSKKEGNYKITKATLDKVKIPEKNGKYSIDLKHIRKIKAKLVHLKVYLK